MMHVSSGSESVERERGLMRDVRGTQPRANSQPFGGLDVVAMVDPERVRVKLLFGSRVVDAERAWSNRRAAAPRVDTSEG